MSTDIRTLFKKKLKHEATPREREIIRSDRDWMFGLGVMVIVFACGAAYVGYDFYKYLRFDVEINSGSEEGIVYRDKDVRFVLEKYSEKAKLFKALRENRSYVPPPVVVEELPEPLAGEEVSE